MAVIKHIPADYIKPHYSTKLWRSYYHYVKKYYSEALFDSVIEELGMPKSYILQDGNWVSDEFSVRFMSRMKEVTGDPHLAENVCRFSLDPDNINPFEYALIKAMPPFVFMAAFPFEFRKVNAFVSMRTTMARPGHFGYEFDTPSSQSFDPSVCEGLAGTFQSAAALYGLKDFKFEHQTCVHKGSDKCRFEVSYNANPLRSRLLHLLVALIGTVWVLANFSVSVELEPGTARFLLSVATVTSVTLMALLTVVLVRTRAVIKHSVVHHEQSRQKNEALFESRTKLERRYQEAKLLRELSLDLVQARDPSNVIRRSLDALEATFHYRKSFVMLLNASGDRLNTFEVRGLGAAAAGIHRLSLLYPDPRPKQLIFTKILEMGATVLIDDVARFAAELTPENRELVQRLEVHSIIVSPIQSNDMKYGLVVIGASGNDALLTAEDRHLVENVTRLFSVNLKTARQLEQETSLRVLFQKYVPSLVLDETGVSISGKAQRYMPEAKVITSMFVDLRGFSRLSEGTAPERVAELLNLYFDFVTRFIEREGGLVDNLVGDCVVAFFMGDNTEKNGGHAQRALDAATGMLAGLDELVQMFASRGFSAPGLGIGLHSGQSVVGSIGCDRKLNYTAIGDVVNLASRLQEYSKKFYKDEPLSRGVLVMSDATLAQVRNASQMIDLGTIPVRGRASGIRAYRMTPAELPAARSAARTVA